MSATERWSVTFEPQEPFAVSRHLSRGNLRETAHRVPGRTLRGALANLLEATSPSLAERIHEGLIRIGDARPAPDPQPVFPIPATLRSCKRKPGFGKEDEHGVIDLLTHLLRAAGDRKNSVPSDCPICKIRFNALTPLKPYRGEGFQRLPGSPPVYREVRVKTGGRTHTAMDHFTGTVAPGFLYDEEFILPESETAPVWSALLHLPAGSGRELKEALTGRTVFIGSSRTRGRGRWKVRGLEAEDRPWGLDPLAKRLDQLQKAVGAKPGQLVVPFLCVTPLVLPDMLGRFRVEPDSASMALALDPTGSCLSSAQLSPLLTLADLEPSGGWNGLPGLPASSDPAFVPGSVLVWRIATPDPGKVIGLLSDVERNGLGLRRAEGMGAIVIAHPIHIEVREHVQ